MMACLPSIFGSCSTFCHFGEICLEARKNLQRQIDVRHFAANEDAA